MHFQRALPVHLALLVHFSIRRTVFSFLSAFFPLSALLPFKFPVSHFMAYLAHLAFLLASVCSHIPLAHDAQCIPDLTVHYLYVQYCNFFSPPPLTLEWAREIARQSSMARRLCDVHIYTSQNFQARCTSKGFDAFPIVRHAQSSVFLCDAPLHNACGRNFRRLIFYHYGRRLLRRTMYEGIHCLRNKGEKQGVD